MQLTNNIGDTIMTQTTINITVNPTEINQTLDGRKSSYKAGVASPAVWYWQAKRGDKKIAKQLLSAKDARRFCGFRLENKLAAVCQIGEYWYTVTI
jgi:hypothetical protein